MKTKTLAVLLCAALVAVPAKADNSPSKTTQPCFIEIIGVIVIVGIYCMNRWGDVHWQPSPPLPYPPDLAPNTNAPPGIENHPLPNLPNLEIGPVMSRSVSNAGTNTYSGSAVPWTNQMTFVVQCSTDLQSWQDWIRVNVWQSSNGALVSIDDGTNTVTAYQPTSLRPPSNPPGNFFRQVAK